jgi:hypothetical protein
VLRGLSGIAAGGLVALFVALLVGWVLTTRTGTAGPGAAMLVGHGIAAVAAVVGQVVADRRTDRVGALAAAGVVVVAVAVLCGYWLF